MFILGLVSRCCLTTDSMPHQLKLALFWRVYYAIGNFLHFKTQENLTENQFMFRWREIGSIARFIRHLTQNKLSFFICIIYPNRFFLILQSIADFASCYWNGLLTGLFISSSCWCLKHHNSECRSSKRPVTGDSFSANISTYANEVMTIYRDNEVAEDCFVSHDQLYYLSLPYTWWGLSSRFKVSSTNGSIDRMRKELRELVMQVKKSTVCKQSQLTLNLVNIEDKIFCHSLKTNFKETT